MADYAHTNLEDIAPYAEDDLGRWQEYRPATSELGAQRTGVALQRYKPGVRQGFAHRHLRAEELFVVLSGSGRVKLDEDVLELRPLDALRVAPHVMRCWEAGPDGLEVLAFGNHEGPDWEIVDDWWTD
jgi:mannose-6-phosphate isomerase-like protein (cupin superfamily)